MTPRVIAFLQVGAGLGSVCSFSIFAALDLQDTRGFNWAPFWLVSFGLFFMTVLWRELVRALQARPNIVLSRVFADQRPWDDMRTRERYAILHFVHVDFKNDPRLRESSAKAKDVVAHLRYYHADGKTLATSIDVLYGRWAHKEQPSLRGPFGSVDDLLSTDMDVTGRPYTLTLALKYPEDDISFVWDNTIAKDYDLRRDWRYRLRGEYFRVHVTLTGEGVEREWWFSVRNLGAGNGMQIEQWDKH